MEMGMSKRAITGIMLTMLLISMLTMAINVQLLDSELPLVSLNPVHYVASLSESFTIRVDAINVNNYFGADFFLYWNEAILQLTDVKINETTDSVVNHLTSAMVDFAYFLYTDHIEFSATFVWVEGATAFEGNGTIAWLTFNATTVGVSSLTFDETWTKMFELVDLIPDEMDTGPPVGGSVTVGTILMGVMGPMAWMQGQGMKEGAEIARDEINAEGGILGFNVDLVFADTLRGMPDPTAATGAAAAMELVAAGVDFAVGGFRSNATFGAREVFMDSAAANDKPIFFIAGASADELIDCGDETCGACVRCDYDRYKYLFRVAPANSTMFFYSLAAFCKYVMATKLMPIFTGYGSPLPIAVISENLTWADSMHTYLTTEYFWNTIMGMQAYGNVSVVYSARVSPTATDVSSELLAVEAAGAKLLIHVLSGPAGRTFITQWKDLEIHAVPVGIDIVGQEIPLHWEATGGNCEYETLLAVSGMRTPLSAKALAFWDAYEARWGHAPVYTSFGAYDAIYTLKEMIEAAGRWPMTADEMVPLIEQTDRDSTLGRFKFTGPHPMSAVTYDTYMANATHSYLDINPTMKGTLHDVYMTSAELGPVWYPPYYTRPLFVQWQKSPLTGKARLEVVWPQDQAYSRRWKIPTWIYSLAETDISGAYGFPDGLVDIDDVAAVAFAYGSKAGDPDWNSEADMDGNGIINVVDFSRLTKDFGKEVEFGASMGTASPMSTVTQMDSATMVYLDPPTINGTAVGVNNTITVNLMIRDAHDVRAWQAGLAFNSTLLECEVFVQDEFLQTIDSTVWGVPNVATPIDNETGVIAPHACSFLGDVSASGSGKLAYFRFKVKEPGVSDLHLRDVLVMNNSDPLRMVPFDIIDTYTVTSSAAQTVFTVSNSTGVQSDPEHWLFVGDTPVPIVYGSGFSGHAFSHPDEELRFNVTGPNPGFSNVTIPKELIEVRKHDPDKLLVTVDGTPLRTEERTVTFNGSHYSVYFNYDLGVHNISNIESPPVYNIDSNRYYAKIQDAINASETSYGHTIIVDEGIYYEHVVVDKSVSLTTENIHNTTIDGNGTGTAIKITASNVNMSYFTIKNSGTNECGILVDHSSGNNISQNNITNNYYGILLYHSSNNNLTNNNASNNELGICLHHSKGNSLSNNTMVGNKYNFGLYGAEEAHFDNAVDLTNTVDGKQIYYEKEVEDTVYNSLTNIGTLYLIDCDNVTLRNLTLTKNIHGIFLWNTTNSKIQNVTASNNLNGIYIQGQSNDNNIINNTVSNNELGIYLHSSNNTDIYHNSFINNTIQTNVTESYNNTWDDGYYPSGGNYWSDHTHSDYYSGPSQNEQGNDGIVDTPYVINANNTDNYPLVSPLTTPVFNINTHLGYTIIQQAIAAVKTLPGHTIIVRAGTYYEQVIINKPLTLIGIIGSTVIDGDGIGTVVTITTDDVTLRGFTIQGSGSSTMDSGIFLSSADNVVINKNTITTNKSGIYVYHSDGCFIGGNNIKANPYSGIRLESSSSTNIIINNITDNYYGIFLNSSNGNYIHGNNLTDNDEGIHLLSSNYNTIYHNNFNNTIQVYSYPDSYPNTWDDGYPSGGNYWSDYKERYPYATEIDDSGIWDTPYDVHQPTGQKDNYPLVNPWIQPHDVTMISVVPHKTVVGGDELLINVNVENHGYFTETFNVTAYYNETNPLAVQTIVLTSGSSTTITFTLNTTGVPCGNYSIAANATIVPGEIDTADNTYTDGWVVVTILGDVSGDQIVDGLDKIMVGLALFTVPGDLLWNPNADVSDEGWVDGLDKIIVGMHLFESCP